VAVEAPRRNAGGGCAHRDAHGAVLSLRDPTGVETSTSGALALVWALLPLAAGLVVKSLQSKGVSH